MKDIIKVSRDGRNVNVEFLYADEVELALAFITLIEAITNEETPTKALEVAIKLCEEGTDDLFEQVGRIEHTEVFKTGKSVLS